MLACVTQDYVIIISLACSHSHYELYAVITDEIPDTSMIEPTENSYIAFAGLVPLGQLTPVTIGTGVGGQITPPNGPVVDYDNRLVVLGANYFFFIRLYSSVVSDTVCVSTSLRVFFRME